MFDYSYNNVGLFVGRRKIMKLVSTLTAVYFRHFMVFTIVPILVLCGALPKQAAITCLYQHCMETLKCNLIF